LTARSTKGRRNSYLSQFPVRTEKVESFYLFSYTPCKLAHIQDVVQELLLLVSFEHHPAFGVRTFQVCAVQKNKQIEVCFEPCPRAEQYEKHGYCTDL
jgi:hypothetical protein